MQASAFCFSISAFIFLSDRISSFIFIYKHLMSFLFLVRFLTLFLFFLSGFLFFLGCRRLGGSSPAQDPTSLCILGLELLSTCQKHSPRLTLSPAEIPGSTDSSNESLSIASPIPLYGKARAESVRRQIISVAQLTT